MPPLDRERGDFPSRADELARRREIHERKCKSGLRKRREIFLGYRHISAHFTPSIAVFSWVPSAREAAWEAEAETALTKFTRPLGEGEGRKAFQLSEQFLVLITCRDEKQQVELLGRFLGEGLECKALVG